MEEQTTLLIFFKDFNKKELVDIMEEVTSCIMFGFDNFKIDIDHKNKGSYELIRNTLPDFKENEFKHEVINGVLYKIIKSKI
jgi:hypothetical protein